MADDQQSQDVSRQNHGTTPPVAEGREAAQEAGALSQRSRSFQRSRSRVTRRKVVQVAGSLMLTSVMPGASQVRKPSISQGEGLCLCLDWLQLGVFHAELHIHFSFLRLRVCARW
jgi:hypothetical protein